VGRHPVGQELIQVITHGDPVRIDRNVARVSDQLGTLDLCLALRALERMPAALALALRVLGVNDDSPMTGGSLANVSFHDFPSIDLRRVSIINLFCSSMPFSIRSKTRWTSGESGDSRAILFSSLRMISECSEH